MQASLHCLPLPRSQLFELVLGRKSKRRTYKVLGLLVLINDSCRCAKWTIGTVSPGLSYRLLSSWIHFESALLVLGKKGWWECMLNSSSLTYRQYMAYYISLCVPTPRIGARNWPGRREEPKAGATLHHHLYKGRRGEVCSRLDQLGKRSRRDRKLHRRPPT